MVDSVQKSNQTLHLFAWLFLLTGIFALVGSLFTWGLGWIFAQPQLKDVLMPLADLFITAPLSILAALGIWLKKDWGIPTGLMASGIYIFGSVLVYISIVWNGPPYPLQFVIPPIFGFCFAGAFFIWVIKNRKLRY